MPFEDIVAIVPASGKGRRFGQPKNKALHSGKTFTEMIRTALEEAGIKRVAIASGLETPDMLSTLRQAVRELKDSQATGYLIWPVDHPFVSAMTARALCEAFLAQPDAVIRPSYHGRSGHPVLIPAWLNLEQNDAGQGLAGLIRSQVCTVIDIPVDDASVLRNVNTLFDLEE